MFIINPQTISGSLINKMNQELDKLKINTLFARAVLQEKAEGLIIVDNESNAKTFYIKHTYGLSLLFGDTQNQKFIENVMTYLASEKSETKEYLQISEPNSFNIDDFTFPKIELFERVNFIFNENAFRQLDVKYPEKYTVNQTTQNNFNQITGKVVPNKFYKNSREFSARSVGFSVIDSGIAVSTAFAAFICDGEMEVAIETHGEYQGQNLAFVSCSVLINYCLEHNYKPVWSCRKDNIGSYKLALKLGFEPTIFLPFYELNF